MNDAEARLRLNTTREERDAYIMVRTQMRALTGSDGEWAGRIAATMEDCNTLEDELARVRKEHAASLGLHDANAQKLATDLIVMRADLERQSARTETIRLALKLETQDRKTAEQERDKLRAEVFRTRNDTSGLYTRATQLGEENTALRKELEEAKRPRMSNPNVTCVNKTLLEQMREEKDKLRADLAAANVRIEDAEKVIAFANPKHNFTREVIGEWVERYDNRYFGGRNDVQDESESSNAERIASIKKAGRAFIMAPKHDHKETFRQEYLCQFPPSDEGKDREVPLCSVCAVTKHPFLTELEPHVTSMKWICDACVMKKIGAR